MEITLYLRDPAFVGDEVVFKGRVERLEEIPYAAAEYAYQLLFQMADRKDLFSPQQRHSMANSQVAFRASYQFAWERVFQESRQREREREQREREQLRRDQLLRDQQLHHEQQRRQLEEQRRQQEANRQRDLEQQRQREDQERQLGREEKQRRADRHRQQEEQRPKKSREDPKKKDEAAGGQRSQQQQHHNQQQRPSRVNKPAAGFKPGDAILAEAAAAANHAVHAQVSEMAVQPREPGGVAAVGIVGAAPSEGLSMPNLFMEGDVAIAAQLFDEVGGDAAANPQLVIPQKQDAVPAQEAAAARGEDEKMTAEDLRRLIQDEMMKMNAERGNGKK